MKHIRVAALVTLVLAPASAFGQSYPSPHFNNLTVGGTVSAGVLQGINVKDAPYSAKGDTTGSTDGTIAAGSNAFLSNAATFTSADVGKSIILHGSGASGAPQQGTITGFTDAHHVTVSFTSTFATPWSGAWAASVATAQSGAGSYAPSDTLTVSGGTGVVTAPVFSIATTKVASATVNAAGSGGTNGTCTVAGTTGTGTKFTAGVTISSGAITAINSISNAGSYTTNPTSLTAEPVANSSGCGSITGATFTLAMGVATVTSNTGGQAVQLPTNPVSTTTSGSGTGATLTLTPFQIGGQFHYGTDDSAAVASAIAAGTSAAKCVLFPSGGYWLATRSTPISVTNACLRGVGTGKNFFPFTGAGSLLFISNSSSAAFSGFAGTTVDSMGFYYPGTDNSQSTPVIQQPLFQADSASAGNVNDWFANNRIINAWQAFYVTTSGSLARSFFSNNLIYGINDDFYLQNGFADVIQGINNYFGPGAFGAQANNGPANLQRWTLNNGSLFRLDMSGGGYPNADGLAWTSGIVQSHRYGIQLMSGLLDVSNISNVNWDGVGTILDVSGTAQVLSTSITGGEAYSIHYYDPTQAASVVKFNTSAAGNQLTLSGIHFTYAQGSVVEDVQGKLAYLTLTGNSFLNYGRSTTSASYYAAQSDGGQTGQWTVSGNTVLCTPNTGHTVSGFLVTASAGEEAYTGNTFQACTVDVRITGLGGTILLSGNASQSSGSSVVDVSTGSLLTTYEANAWDKAPSYRAPSVASCGTSPSVAGNNQNGTVTIGTGTVTSCSVSFTSALPYAPTSVVLSDRAGNAVYPASVTTSGFTINAAPGVTSIGGDAISYQVTT